MKAFDSSLMVYALVNRKSETKLAEHPLNYIIFLYTNQIPCISDTTCSS